MLRLEGIDAGYGRVQVLRGIDVEVDEGKLVCMLGRNGAGKTTTLSVAAGLLRPWRGRVLLADEDVSRLTPEDRLRKGMALVPEGRGMLPAFSVRENLLMGAYVRTESGFDFSDEVERVTTVFPVLRERLDQRAGSLSGGEQQMLAIARAMMSGPRVLLVDEPSLGLAPFLVEELYELFAKLRDEGNTLFLVEQYAELALDVADQAYILEKGSLVASGTGAGLAEREQLLSTYLG